MAMRYVRYLLLSLTLLAGNVAPAQAQITLAELQSKMAGSWLVTVEGEQRTRTMVIDTVAQKAEGTYVLVGTFNFSDGRPTPFKDGELLQSSGNLTIVLTTGSGAIYTVTAKGDGTFAGTTKYANGQVKPTTFAKGAGTTVAAAPAPKPAAIIEFDGKWSGDAFPSQDCVRGVYDLTVQNGVIAGKATFMSNMGQADSIVSGQIRPDKTAMITLRQQQPYGRSSRFQGVFDGNGFKGSDAGTGRCSYEVKLKKG